MKRIILVVTTLVLCSTFVLASCQVPKPLLILSPSMAGSTVGDWQELTATVTEGGTPVSGVEIRFEFSANSVHNTG